LIDDDVKQLKIYYIMLTSANGLIIHIRIYVMIVTAEIAVSYALIYWPPL